MGADYCCVSGCKNNSRNMKHLSFFTLPSDKKRQDRWLQCIQRDDIPENPGRRFRVCSVHFKPTMFINKRLNRRAIPSLCLPREEGDTEDDLSMALQEANTDIKKNNTVATTQTDTEEISLKTLYLNAEVRQKKKLKQALLASEMKRKLMLRKLNRLQMKINRQDYVGKMKRRKLDARPDNLDSTDQFINWQKQLKFKLKAITDEYSRRHFALNFYLKNPQIYTFLQKSFKLPSLSALRSFPMNFRPGIHDDSIQLLSNMCKTMPDMKYCALFIDKVVVRKHIYYDITNDEVIGLQDNGVKTKVTADDAYVLILKGLSENFKIPIGYSFLARNSQEAFGEWINEAVNQVFNHGFVLVAVITTHEKMFINLAKEKGVTVNEPYFMINKMKVYYLYNISDVLKRIQDNLIIADISYNAKKASWKYIKEFYEKDKQRDVELAPNLNEAAFIPTDNTKFPAPWNRKHALTREVAVGMMVDMGLGNLGIEANDTVDFIMRINNIINVIKPARSKHLRTKNKVFLTDNQMSELRRNASKFNNAKNSNRCTAQTFSAFRLTVNAILGINMDYESRINVNELTKDVTHLFFQSLSKIGGKTWKPTPIKFKRAYSKLTLSLLLKLAKHKDLESFLLNKRISVLFEQEMSRPLTFSVHTVDYRFRIPEDTFHYACCYLLKKCILKHLCPDFKNYVKKQKKVPLKQNWKNNPNLFEDFVSPPPEFVEYIEVLENIFLNSFEECSLSVGTARAMLEIMKEVEFQQPCPCFPVYFLTRLYIRTRIYFVMKMNNSKDVSHVLVLKHL